MPVLLFLLLFKGGKKKRYFHFKHAPTALIMTVVPCMVQSTGSRPERLSGVNVWE